MKKKYIFILSILSCNIYCQKDKIPVDKCADIYKEYKNFKLSSLRIDPQWENIGKPKFFKCLVDQLITDIENNSESSVADYLNENYAKDAKLKEILKKALIRSLAFATFENKKDKEKMLAAYIVKNNPNNHEKLLKISIMASQRLKDLKDSKQLEDIDDYIDEQIQANG